MLYFHLYTQYNLSPPNVLHSTTTALAILSCDCAHDRSLYLLLKQHPEAAAKKNAHTVISCRQTLNGHLLYDEFATEKMWWLFAHTTLHPVGEL